MNHGPRMLILSITIESNYLCLVRDMSPTTKVHCLTIGAAIEDRLSLGLQQQ